MQLVWLHPTHPLSPSHPPNFLPKKPGGPKDGRKGSADNMCERVFAGLRDHDFCDPVCVCECVCAKFSLPFSVSDPLRLVEQEA